MAIVSQLELAIAGWLGLLHLAGTSHCWLLVTLSGDWLGLFMAGWSLMSGGDCLGLAGGGWGLLYMAGTGHLWLVVAFWDLQGLFGDCCTWLRLAIASR